MSSKSWNIWKQYIRLVQVSCTCILWWSIWPLTLSVREPHLCLCKQVGSRPAAGLAWDPTCFLLSPSFPVKNKQSLKVLKSRRQYNLFLEKYPAFKELRTLYIVWSLVRRRVARRLTRLQTMCSVLKYRKIL